MSGKDCLIWQNIRMTKSELVIRLAARFPALTQQDCRLTVDAILDAIGDSLKSGGRVEVRGFGSFGVRVRPPRIGRNPKTGEKVQVPDTPAPFFKAGKELKGGVDQSFSSEKRMAA